MEGFSMSKVRTTVVDLFTPDEHAVLADWFGVKSPAIAQDIPPDEAISRLGFDKRADFYRRIDAAVAFTVLERVEQRLPQWSAIRGDELIVAREYRDDNNIPNRKVLLQPRHLFTVNWADSGPGFSWPTAYYDRRKPADRSEMCGPLASPTLALITDQREYTT